MCQKGPQAPAPCYNPPTIRIIVLRAGEKGEWPVAPETVVSSSLPGSTFIIANNYMISNQFNILAATVWLWIGISILQLWTADIPTSVMIHIFITTREVSLIYSRSRSSIGCIQLCCRVSHGTESRRVARKSWFVVCGDFRQQQHRNPSLKIDVQ